jgi:predicted nuclease of predicted toxin-antitoxin system
MLRLLADENFNNNLVRGLLRRRPLVDIVRAQDVDLARTPDPEVLAWAAREQRIVLTHDVKTMPHFASERLQRGEPMAGMFLVHQWGNTPSSVLDDLVLLDDCSETAEWAGRFLYLPLR